MLYSAGDIAEMLRIFADADNNSDIGIDINSILVVRVFVFEQKSEYYLSYSDYFGYEGYGYLLCHRSIGVDGQNTRRVTSIGYVCSTEATRNVSIVRWGAGLGWLESLNIVQCLVRETKKQEARAGSSPNSRCVMFE